MITIPFTPLYSVSEVVSSANGVGAMEGWIDPKFGHLEPLQEPIDLFQDMSKQPYVVDAVKL